MSNEPMWSPSGRAPQIDFGNALRYSWTRYKENIGPWLMITAVYIVAQWFGGAGVQVLLTPQAYSYTQILRILLGIVVSLTLTIAIVHGALSEVDNRKPTFGDFFGVQNWAQALGTSICVGVLVAAPISLLMVTAVQMGLITGVATNSVGSGMAAGAVIVIVALVLFVVLTTLTYFAVWFSLDQRQGPIAAIRSSFGLARRNVKPIILMILIFLGFQIVEQITFLVASLVLMPLTYLTAAYVFRNLAVGTVAPVEAQQPEIGGYFPPGVPQGGGFTEPPYPSYPPTGNTAPPAGGFTEPPYPPIAKPPTEH
ncbi:MAG: hypothetical protein LLG14_13495 [Nocardiaceae bacterium]|nr:hypothetical protein [Nocardiaceae bacterium]